MVKKYLLIGAMTAQSALFGAAAHFVPQPGYFFNGTTSIIEISIYDVKPDSAFILLKQLTLQPYEFAKMDQFNGVSKQVSEKHVIIKFKTPDRPDDSFELSQDLLDGLGGGYVIYFEKAARLPLQITYKIIPEKEFRDLYAKELEAYPVCGGVQRLIAGYALPCGAHKGKTTGE